MSKIVGYTTKVPRHQLRDDLEVGDNVNANGFYFETISVGEDWVVLECLEDLTKTNENDR